MVAQSKKKKKNSNWYLQLKGLFILLEFEVSYPRNMDEKAPFIPFS